MARLNRSRRSRSRFSTPSRMETSNMDTGSSARNASGPGPSARAVPPPCPPAPGGPGTERAGDRHPLRLAAGELVRELVEVALGRGQADPGEQLVQGRLEVAAV